MADVTIEVRKNGSYRVYGDVNLVDHEGNQVPVPEASEKSARKEKRGSRYAGAAAQ